METLTFEKSTQRYFVCRNAKLSWKYNEDMDLLFWTMVLFGTTDLF